MGGWIRESVFVGEVLDWERFSPVECLRPRIVLKRVLEIHLITDHSSWMDVFCATWIQCDKIAKGNRVDHGWLLSKKCFGK